MKRCENCNRRIGFIRRLRKKFFHAKVWKRREFAGFIIQEDIYFCSYNCIEKYSLLNPGLKILN